MRTYKVELGLYIPSLYMSSYCYMYVSSCCYICPHTAICVFSYCYVSSCCCVCVLMLLLMLPYMYPRTTSIYVFSYSRPSVHPTTQCSLNICVIYKCLYICIYTYIYIHIYTYIYIYIYIYTYIYMHIYITHTHTHPHTPIVFSSSKCREMRVWGRHVVGGVTLLGGRGGGVRDLGG